MRHYLLLFSLFLSFSFLAKAQFNEIDSSHFDFENPETGNYITLRDISNCRLGGVKTSKDSVIEYVLLLLKSTNFILQIEAHTDCRANEEFNKYQSQMIANAYKRFFLLKGIDSSRVAAKGMGSDSLLIKKCNCGLADEKSKCLEIEHLLNRRTILRIVGRKED